jgi:ABC-type lipoprotein release transport system permease subunit
MAWIAGRYAARSVRRNIRRTLLSVAGIAIGCVLATFMESMNRGREELFARAGAYSGNGHVRVVPSDWPERRDVRLRLADWQQDVRALEAMAGVTALAPRARAQVLLAMGTRVTPVEMAGVDPTLEPKTDRFVRTIQRGRYLSPTDTGTVVIGQAIAKRLSADLDDDILSTVVGKGGDIASAMFRIVGIVKTGSDELDMTICQVPIRDLERFSGLPGAGEISIILADWRRTDAFRAELSPHLAPGDVAITWGEINPEFKGHMQQDARSEQLISGIILLIVLLGVTSAQLASVMERRREFAVLAALGMSTWTMIRLVVQEALTLGLAGGTLGLVVGAPVVWEFSKHGLDFTGYFGTNYSFGGTFFEPIFYGDFGLWIVPYVYTVALGATLVASLYPARFAARTDPAAALRVAQ